MMLSRKKGDAGGPGQGGDTKGMSSLEQFLAKRDYTGAITMLEFEKSSGRTVPQGDLWLGYCWFHLGDYKKAAQIYESLLDSEDPSVNLNLACCYFHLSMFSAAEKASEDVENTKLKTRVLFHLSHRMGDENKLVELHKELQNNTQDMLSLAAIHFLRSHYQEAIDIYKTVLLDNREYLAVNVYVALCYYKLDYYDVCQEVISVYLNKYPDSLVANNLKACTQYKVFNGKAAEQVIKPLLDAGNARQDLLKHNLVVFRGGEGALQVLPALVNTLPEARLNLVIYHFKQGEYSEAYELIKHLEPSVPHEYILKGIANVVIGQETGSREEVKSAVQYFQVVGNSDSECDTIPGRQCMASAFFLQRQFDDVHIYLSSIKTYFFNDDAFNFNYAQSKCALGNFKEAEDAFLLVKNEKIKNDYIYISHLARCYIMGGKGQEAWELYLKMETSAESYQLLQVLANDCYRMGQFYQAAKAFDLLERLDPTPEHWEGKRAACVGAFQLIIADKLPSDLLADVVQLLRNSTNPQVEAIIRVIKRWAKDNRINI